MGNLEEQLKVSKGSNYNKLFVSKYTKIHKTPQGNHAYDNKKKDVYAMHQALAICCLQ